MSVAKLFSFALLAFLVGEVCGDWWLAGGICVIAGLRLCWPFLSQMVGGLFSGNVRR